MERIELTRDCEAVQIPAGHPVTLEKGTDVFITQSHGGSYTVQVFRIAGKDADAIGKEPIEAPAAEAGEEADLERQVWDQLKTCYDPEIPVNIVDLGLVYDMRRARHRRQPHRGAHDAHRAGLRHGYDDCL